MIYAENLGKKAPWQGKERIMAKKTTLVALSVSLAMVLSFLETLIPPLVAVPGIKPGIANAVTLFLLYKSGWKCASLVSLVRVCLSALLFGSAITFLYSAAGATLSLLLMIFLKRVNIFSVVGVSVSGAVMHNAAQIGVCALIMETTEIAYYLPVLVISGTVSGVCVGIIAGLVARRVRVK